MAESVAIDDKVVHVVESGPGSAAPEYALADEGSLPTSSSPPAPPAPEESTGTVPDEDAVSGSKELVDQDAASGSPRAVDESPPPLLDLADETSGVDVTGDGGGGVGDESPVDERVAAEIQEDATDDANAPAVSEVAEGGPLQQEKTIEPPAGATVANEAQSLGEPVAAQATTTHTEIVAPTADDDASSEKEELVSNVDVDSSGPIAVGGETVPGYGEAAPVLVQEAAAAPEVDEEATTTDPTDENVEGAAPPPDAADPTPETTAAHGPSEAVEPDAADEMEPVDATEPVEVPNETNAPVDEPNEDTVAPVDATLENATTEKLDEAAAPTTIISTEQAVIEGPDLPDEVLAAGEDSPPSEPVEPAAAASAADEGPEGHQLTDAESAAANVIDEVGAEVPESSVLAADDALDAFVAPAVVAPESGNEELAASPVEVLSETRTEEPEAAHRTAQAIEPEIPATTPSLASPSLPSDPDGEVSKVAELSELIPVEGSVIPSAVESIAPADPSQEPSFADEVAKVESEEDSPLVEGGTTTTHAVDPAVISGTVANEEEIAQVSPKKLHIPVAFLGANDATAERLSPEGGSSQSPVRKLAVPAAFSGGLESKVSEGLAPPDLGTPKKLAIPTAFGGSGTSPEIENSNSNADATPPNTGTPNKLVIPTAFGGERSKSPFKASSPVNKSPQNMAVAASGNGADIVPVKAAEHALSEQKQADTLLPASNDSPAIHVYHESPPGNANVIEAPRENETDDFDVGSEGVAIETEYVPDPSPSGTPSKLQIPTVFAGSSNHQHPSTSEGDGAPRRTTPDHSPRKLIIPSAFAVETNKVDDVKPGLLMDEPAALNDLSGSPEKSEASSEQESKAPAPLALPEHEGGAPKQTKSQLLKEIKRVEKEMAAVQAQSRAASSESALKKPKDPPGHRAPPEPKSVEGVIEQKSASADTSDDAGTFVDPSSASVNISLHSDPGTIPVVPHYSVTVPAVRHTIEPCLEAPEDEVEESSPRAQEILLVKPEFPLTSSADKMMKSPEKTPPVLSTDADAETAAPSETTPEKAVGVSPSTESGKVTSPLPSPTNSEPVLSNCGSCSVL